jgi:hypothetical protein
MWFLTPPIFLAHLGASAFSSRSLRLMGMSPPGRFVRKAGIITEIEAIFDSLSVQRSEAHFCQQCGTAMVDVETLFFLTDAERGWSVGVPVCPKCCGGSKLPAPHLAVV